MNYHFVWSPKYRRKVITGKVERRLKELLREKSEEMGCKVLALETMPDHVHIFIQGTPILAPNRIVAGLKGYSSRVLRAEFPHLTSSLPTLWTRSYFVSTHGHVSAEAYQKVCRGRKSMIISYKFRLYPTSRQAKLMDETLETCRRLYNSLLSDRIENRTGFYDQKKSLAKLKIDDKFLKAVHSQVLQDVSLRLDKAFQSFFARLSKYPRFKRRGGYNSFTYPQYKVGFNLSGNFLKLGKIGRVKIRIHRPIAGTIKRATIIREIDQWFVGFSIEQTESPRGNKEKRNPAIGVDRGITNLVAMSSGETISNPKFLKQSVEKIKRLQRELSRKKKGSKNREKAKLSLAKAWRKVRRRRDDFTHKLSFKLTSENGTIVFEDLKINSMVKNHNLAVAIMDSSLGKAPPTNCLQGRKAGWPGSARQPRRNIAEMLKVRGSGSKVSVRENTSMHEMWPHPG